MYKRRKYKLIIVLLSMFVFISNMMVDVSSLSESEDSVDKVVLYINSYHEGYKWSDDIYDTIDASFSSSKHNVRMETIYLDTQRIVEVNPTKYYESIANALQIQYMDRHVDLIMTSDDAAFEFVEDYLGFFDQDIPLIYCGVNELTKINDNVGRPKGGVVEYIDIQDTINLIETLHPNVDTIYYIADNTLTGVKIENELLDQIALNNGSIKFTKLDGVNLASIKDKISELDSNAVILYTIYFYDNEDTYYNYDKSIHEMSMETNVPIYGLWEFTLGHGIVGGKLLSGLDQGQAAAKHALSYFDDEEFELVNVINNNNTYKFDYKQLLNYEIDINKLPKDSDIINYSTIDKQNILVIHSYNSGFQWTDHIMEGITDALKSYNGSYEVFTEYMDLKRIDTPVYLNEYENLFYAKHNMKEYDLIITSDDAAFDFAKGYIKKNNQKTPIVFSGVNYLEPIEISEHNNYTGVMEAYDLVKTLELIQQLQPEVKRIMTINDETVTGKANRTNIQNIISSIPDLDIYQIEDNTMSEVVELVSKQNANTAILLMSFNKDRANNSFSYAESIKIIEEASSVPIYGVWDFYLGDGVVGGFMTSGYEQGMDAGLIGVSILNGEKPRDIQIITKSPNRYMIDMEQIDKYNINKVNIPKDVLLINENQTILDVYVKYKNVFNVALIIILFVFCIFAILSYFLRNTIKMNKKITRLANYDQLLGILNRREGINRFKEYVKDSSNKDKHASICFVDINDLKQVNDKYGHSEGDDYIINVVKVINEAIDKDDIFCRMGGDEFMIVIKDQIYGSKEFVQKVKEDLIKVSMNSGKSYNYSISAGVKTFQINEYLDISKIIEAADSLMYSDKANYKANYKANT